MRQDKKQAASDIRNSSNMEAANELAPSFFQREEHTQAHSGRLVNWETKKTKQLENRK